MSDGVLFTSHEISNPAELLSVGGVKARKGAIPALEMLAAYNARYSHPAVLRFVGSLTQDPPYVARAIARAEALGLTSSVYWEGQISDDELARRYARADAFVMLSVPEGNEFEGFGLVYLEANARGIPVVGAYGSGAEDAIANGTSGFLVHADNPAEGAATLHRLLTNRDTLSRSAYAWAQQHTWNTVAQKFETFYALVRKDA